MKVLEAILLLYFTFFFYSLELDGQESIELIVKNDTVQIIGVFIDAEGDTAKIGQVLVRDTVGRLDWADLEVISDSTLEGTGSTSLPLRISQQGASINQTLIWNGSTWVPKDINHNLGKLANATNWGIDCPLFIDTDVTESEYDLPATWSGQTGDVLTFINKSGQGKLINGDIDNYPSSVYDVSNGATMQFVWDGNNTTWWTKQ